MPINTATLDLLSNEANLIADALKTIDRDHSEQLASLTAQHRTKRSELVQELAALNRALKALRAPLVTATSSAPTTGKKLSEAHKASIKAALTARAAAKKLELPQSASAEKEAATVSSAPSLIESTSDAPAATEEHESGSTKRTAAKKAVARG